MPFITDVFEEILEYTKEIASIPCRLYVTTTNDHVNHIRDCLFETNASLHASSRRKPGSGHIAVFKNHA
jgi:hypothetical protein